jgi:DNA-binding transcriptional regulator YiaG
MVAAARQLHIIDDTMLRGDPQLKIAAAPRASATIERPRASATVDPRIVAIEERRKAAGISHEKFAATAGISFWTWRDLRRGDNPASCATIKKLQAALSAPREPKPIKLISGFHRIVVSLCAAAVGADAAAVLATDMSRQRARNPQWLAAARVQMMATYITAVELEVGNAELARALGTTREAIRKARNRIEDLRDDAALDAALEAVTAQVRV